MDPDQTAPRSSLIRVHTVCLYAKNRFEKFARIFSRRHKQATFSDAGFLGIYSEKVCFDISCKCSTLQMIHMKSQALFSLGKKKMKMLSATF